MDAVTARRVQAAGCPKCGAALDVARFPRKPRGLGEELGQAFAHRESFCCRRCRQRRTPVSLRFLGRRVYVAVVVVLACIAGVGATKAVVLDVPRRTVRRWSRWWTETLVITAFWATARARFSPVLSETMMPASLLDRFGLGAAGLVSMLRFLLPVTSSTCPSHVMDA